MPPVFGGGSPFAGSDRGLDQAVSSFLNGFAAQQQALADAQLLIDLIAFAMLLGNAANGGGVGGGGCGCRAHGRSLGSGGAWGNTRPVSPWGGSAPWGGAGGPQGPSGPYGALPDR